MEQYCVGVIGTGTMGRRMVTLLEAHPGFSVQALYDPSPVGIEAANAFAPHAKAYSTVEEMLSTHPLDVVYIASPPASHLGYMSRCFDRRLPVYCEKPLSIDVDEAARMVERATREHQVVAVNFPFASTPSLAAILNAVHNERSLGAVHAIEIYARFQTWPRPWQADATWLALREEGGFTREVLSHFLFAARRIMATDLVLVEKSTTYPADPRLCETHVEAAFTANRIPITVSIGIGGTVDDENRLTVTGDNGALRMRNWYEGDELVNGAFQPLQLGPDPRGATMTSQLDNLHYLLAGKAHSLATIREAFHVQQHIETLLA